MPWPTPRTGAEELAAGVGPKSDGYIGASLVDGKCDGLPGDLDWCFRIGHTEGTVRPLLVVEAEEGFEIGICVDHSTLESHAESGVSAIPA